MVIIFCVLNWQSMNNGRRSVLFFNIDSTKSVHFLCLTCIGFHFVVVYIYIHIHGNRINLTQTIGRCPFRSMILWGCRPPSFRTSTTVSRQGRGSAPSNTTRCEVSKDLGTPYTGDLRNPAETNSIFAYPRYSRTDKVAGGKTDRRLLVARQMLRDRKPIFDWREFPLTKCILYIVQRLTVTTTTKGSITGSKIPTRL